MDDKEINVIKPVILPACIFVLYCILARSLFNVSGVTVLKFLCLNAVSVFLPGYAILRIIKLKLSGMGVFCMSYILGYASVVVEYFFSELVRRQVSFLAVTLTVGVIAIISITLTKDRNEIRKSEKEIFDVALLFLMVVINLLAFSANFLGTDVAPVLDMHRDMQYWTNNTVALKLAWPADNLFYAGSTLNYHYFSNIPLAFLSEAYGIDVFTLSFPLYGFTKAVIMVGGCGFLLDSLTENFELRVVGYITMLLTAGAESIAIVTFIHHTLLAPFGYDTGYAYGMVFIGFLIRQLDSDKMDWRLWLGSILVWTMCVGAKAPISSVLIIFAAVLCLFWLTKKKWDQAFGYGLGIVASFLVICRYCVGLFSVTSGDSAWTLGLKSLGSISSLGTPDTWDVPGRALVAIGSTGPIQAMIVRAICLNPAVILGTLAAVVIMISYIRNKKTISDNRTVCMGALLLSGLTGIGLWLLVNAIGSSEMYFAMAAVIPLVAMTIYALDLCISERNIIPVKSPALLKGLEAVFGLLILTGMVRYSWAGYSGAGALKSCMDGLDNLCEAGREEVLEDGSNDGIRRSDVEALKWISDNAAQDALIMTDKAVMTEKDYYYMYGMFSERQQYIEGTDMFFGQLQGDFQDQVNERKELVRAVFENEPGAIERAREKGIDYIVRTADITPEFTGDDRLERVKSTETIDVYRIREE